MNNNIILIILVALAAVIWTMNREKFKVCPSSDFAFEKIVHGIGHQNYHGSQDVIAACQRRHPGCKVLDAGCNNNMLSQFWDGQCTVQWCKYQTN